MAVGLVNEIGSCPWCCCCCLDIGINVFGDELAIVE